VVVDADGQRKQTRPLAGVNGEVCKEKKKKAVERKEERLDTGQHGYKRTSTDSVNFDSHCSALFVAKRDYRIDTHGAPRGSVGRGQGDGCEQNGYAGEGEGIVRADSIEHLCQ
jgi:hypothetical protein